MAAVITSNILLQKKNIWLNFIIDMGCEQLKFYFGSGYKRLTEILLDGKYKPDIRLMYLELKNRLNTRLFIPYQILQ